jgi:ferredoxin-NADP reductase
MEYPDTATLTFVGKRHEYADVYSYIFEPLQPVTFTAGQYAHVRLLSLPEDVRRVREISFASSPQDLRIQFGIDNHSGSEYQKALQTLVEGDTIEIFKIKGHMTWPVSVSHTVMIGGGIGVTPFRSMLRDRAQKNMKGTTTVLHVASKSFLYGDELSELATEYKTTSRKGLLTELEFITATYPEAHYYVAGSLGFVDIIDAELRKNGLTRIETDVFKGLIDML